MRYWFVVVLCWLMVGCSSQLGYRFADTLIAWKIDDYVSLNSTQQERVDQDITELHEWHATSELPLYRNTLLQLRDAVQSNTLTATTLEQVTSDGWYFWERVRLQAHPYAQELLPELSEAQQDELLTNLQEKLNERKERYQERIEESPDERFQEELEERRDEVSDWVGRLTEQQESLLQEWLEAEQSRGEMWLNYRQSWLDSFAETLRAGPESENYQSELERLIKEPQNWRSEEMQKSSELNRGVDQRYLLALYKSLNERQRERVVERINSYIEDLDGLIQHFKSAE
ncbi:hypothetical protein SAMN06297229_1349 [Pseudidiomarina planktonica]|uniref:Lipoprotein n=1 Tax=Pseudidiomarina planktonica TaxID=1323738 RepID=A0A1Y6EXN8_9GAMM|nr:DUF6279 family lipoprotein [Pseudidiomarina planktonica]RUO65263.1 hypothetical protein CWI77_02025 [Pseudidiomarina planktonica]SMQ65760.1 hypothetical protein SAMN06297229_1349 [Pseudidiomarina planktonica]